MLAQEPNENWKKSYNSSLHAVPVCNLADRSVFLKNAGLGYIEVTAHAIECEEDGIRFRRYPPTAKYQQQSHFELQGNEKHPNTTPGPFSFVSRSSCIPNYCGG